jgi:hypothetical protein
MTEPSENGWFRTPLVFFSESVELAGCAYGAGYREGDARAGMFFQLDYYGNPERGAVATWRCAEVSGHG